MPGRDGTGPNKKGHNRMKPNGIGPDGGNRMTGQRFGRMNNAPGFRRFGCQIAPGAEAKPGDVDEKTALKANAAYIEMKLKEINGRIETLT